MNLFYLTILWINNSAASKWLIAIFHVVLTDHSRVFSWQMGWNEKSKTISVTWCFIGNGWKASLTLNCQEESLQVTSPARQSNKSLRAGGSHWVPQRFKSSGSCYHLLDDKITSWIKNLFGPHLKMPKLGWIRNINFVLKNLLQKHNKDLAWLWNKNILTSCKL